MSDTNTEAHREAIARRVRGLLAKTVENGCTEDEALAAATKARAIMDAHRLSQSDLEIEAEPIADEWLTRGSDLKLTPADHALWGIDKYCGVKTWFQKRWVSAKNGHVRYVRMLGLKSDVEMATYLYRLIENAIANASQDYDRLHGPEATPHETLRRNTSFRVGMARRLNARLTEMAAALDSTAKTGSGTALVVVKSHAVDAAFAKTGVRLSGTLSGPRARDQAAYMAGGLAGDRVNLNRPVGGKAQGGWGREPLPHTPTKETPMALPRIDYGSLTEEETKTLATNALDQLSLASRVELVLEVFKDADDRAELIAWLEDEDDGPEAAA